MFELLVDVFELFGKEELAFVKFEKVDEFKKFMRLIELIKESYVSEFLQVFDFYLFIVENLLTEFVLFGS